MASMTRDEKRPLSKRLKEIVKGVTSPERPLHSAARFSLLYKEKHLHVFRYIYGLCGGPTPLVEDLTAETFSRAWQARDKFNGDSDAATGWLLRIARNLVIDRQRNRVEQRTVFMDEELDRMSASGWPNAGQSDDGQPEEALLFAEQQTILLALLQELPPDRREMVTLRYLLDWPVKDIASHFEMPENTVTVTMKRALQQMRYRWPLISAEKEETHV